MIKSFLDWVDQRTGYRKLTHEALYENVPGGSRWRYVWGSTLTFALVVQVITGAFLWMSYSASAQTSWESVFYIQNRMFLGWFIRGIHHFTAQVMIILLVLHLMQVLIDGAYKAPREFNFWTGLALLLLVLALSLSGYLLPWDQNGYWATKVVTSIVSIVPVVGQPLQRLVVGGPDFGHMTLTRFLAFHAGVVPAFILAAVVGHIYLFRRHGIKAKQPHKKRDAAFWPDQVLMDAVACLAVLATVLFLVVYYHGSDLGAPADPSESFPTARPEWYFLFLFQFVKYFPSGTEFWGAIFIPSVILLVMFAMPFLGQWKLGHRFNLGLICCLLLGAVLLTVQALDQDRNDPKFQIDKIQADRDAGRARILAQNGIPTTGAISLLHDDPYTQGPRIFAQICAKCHTYGGTDGMGHPLNDPANPQTASDLKDFASRAWLTGLLDPAKVGTLQYLGGPGPKFMDGLMPGFVKDTVAKYTPGEKDDLQKVIAAISAEALLPSQTDLDKRDAALIKQGQDLIHAGAPISCADCHQFHDIPIAPGVPDLTGYGSEEWLTAFINDSHVDRFYGIESKMPALGKTGVLDDHAIKMVVKWLRGDWYEPPAVEKP